MNPGDKWAYSTNDEEFSGTAPTREEAVRLLFDEYEEDYGYVGRIELPREFLRRPGTPKWIAEHFLEYLEESAFEEFGGATQGEVINASKTDLAELGEALIALVESHTRYTGCFGVEGAERVEREATK